MSKIHTLELYNGRNLTYTEDQVKELENEQISQKVLFNIFYPQKNNPDGKAYSRLERYLKCVFQDVLKVQSLTRKNGKDFLLGELINSDGKPEPINYKTGAKAKELTVVFEALLLKALQNKEIDSFEDKTLKQWLIFFNFTNVTFEYDYKKLESERHTELLRDIANYLPTLQIDDDIERTLTKTEAINLFKQYADLTINILISKLKQCLLKMHNNNLITLNGYIYGVKGLKKTVLSPKEKVALNKLELELKTKHKLDGFNIRYLLKHKGFRTDYNKALRDGLKTPDSNNSYDFVYTSYTITQNLTEKELNQYLAKNDRVKVYYDMPLHEIVNAYIHEQVNYLHKKVDGREQFKATDHINKVNKDSRGDISQITSDIENKHNAYAKSGKTLVSNLQNERHKPFSQFN